MPKTSDKVQLTRQEFTVHFNLNKFKDLDKDGIAMYLVNFEAYSINHN